METANGGPSMAEKDKGGIRVRTYVREGGEDTITLTFPSEEDLKPEPLAEGVMEVSRLGHGVGRIDIRTDAIHSVGPDRASMVRGTPIKVKVGDNWASIPTSSPIYVCGWDEDEESIARQMVLLESTRGIVADDFETWGVLAVHITDYDNDELTDEDLAGLGIESADLYAMENARTGEPLRVGHVMGALQLIQSIVANMSISGAMGPAHKGGAQATDAGEAERSARGKTFQAREFAERSGAIMSIGSRLTAFTTEQLKTSFTPRYIVKMPNGIDTQSDGVFDESGRFNENLLNEQNKVLVLDTVQEALLGAVTSIVSDQIKTDDQTNEVSFYLPEIMRELGIDPRGYKKRGNETGELARLRYERMMQLIAPFDRYIGMMPDGSGIYRVLAFSGYDVESEIMRISTPYIYELMRRAQQGDKAYKHRYLHGNVINERSDAAVEVANAIICGVVRRGTLTDKGQGRKSVRDELRVSYDRTYISLVNDCPTLKAKLDAIERSTARNKNQAYNNALKYTFQAAFRIVAEKSDLPKKYVDLHLPTRMETVKGKRRRVYGYPTKSTMRQRMDIWHHGRAPKKDVD